FIGSGITGAAARAATGRCVRTIAGAHSASGALFRRALGRVGRDACDVRHPLLGCRIHRPQVRQAGPTERLDRVGAIALVLLVLAELLLAAVLAGRGVADYVANRDPVSGSVYAGMLLAY